MKIEAVGDLISEMTDRMTIALALELEDRLRAAINKQIGTGWKIDDLRGRLNLVRMVNVPWRSFYLDGKLLFSVRDPKYTNADSKIVVTQEYTES